MFLVNSSDKVIGIWNEESFDVLYAIWYARQKGKEAWLYGVWKEKGIRNLTDEFDTIFREFSKDLSAK